MEVAGRDCDDGRIVGTRCVAEMTDVDPRIRAYAEECVKDLVAEVGREVIGDRREALVERLARAIELAAEQEYGALVEEMTA